jgi:Tfp pilus assembly protein PilF
MKQAGENMDPATKRVDRALHFLRIAYEKQMEGDLQTAIQLYKASIAEHPTAEAHTFLAWTYSFLGRFDEAIEECKRAIEVDPDFGNPYNDIGSYLVHLDKPEEAIPWLEKAKKAPRYEPRHFPYLNLGRIYLKMGRVAEAAREFEQAEFFKSVAEDSEAAEGDSDATLH